MVKRLSFSIAIWAYLVVALVVSAAGQTVKAETSLSMEDFDYIIDNYTEATDYEEYCSQYDESKRPSTEYVMDASDYVRTEDMDVEVLENYEGAEGKSVLTQDDGMIEYEVNIQEEGFYNLSVQYYPVEGKGSAIQRAFFVDGELPYEELNQIEFSRVWTNVKDVWDVDNQGNDLKPEQMEQPEWMTGYLFDAEGYIGNQMAIYLTKGVHTITLVSLKEPMVIRKLILSNEEKTKSYEEMQEIYKQNNYTESSGVMKKINAEDADRKSSQMLYPQQDQSSPAVYPYSAKELKNNTIGGNSWRLLGQWMEWDFEIPESGLYYISMHARQNFVKGMKCSRKILIDGEVPFTEMSQYGFGYQQKWRVENLDSESGEQYLFYLEAGTHTLRMEAVLGDMAEIISDVQKSVIELNSIYRKVIRITGVAPDKYRDYQLEKNLPELQGELEVMAEQLNDIITRLRETAGKGNSKENVLLTMRDQVEMLSKNVEKFTKVVTTYKLNMSALGTWIASAVEQPLALDTIYIYSPDQKLEKLNNSAFAQVVHEVKKLFYSFIIDYNVIGNVAEDTEESKTITVWVGTARDQANVIKALVDEDFTKKTNINVNVMLVDMGTLLQATLAKQGPDVAIQVGNDLPMNYGLRNAVADLSQFEDLDEVKTRFNESAMVPFEFNGATYALPETQTFLMMFYRKDILKELNVEIPKTWDEMKVAMSVFAKNQMELGMLPAHATSPALAEQVWAMLLYQNGGSYYNEDATASNLQSDEAITAFKEYCEFYTDYKLDRVTALDQRFRTGQCPIIISDYTLYNQLQVSAPDIKGLWGFAPVPGTVKEDGTIDNSVSSTGTACVIMEESDEKEASWEFLKWWTSADIQVKYGSEMEGLMGAAARHPTANVEAFSRMPWTTKDYEALAEQFKSVKGIPQVPGGYYSWRNVDNAFYRVVISEDDDKMQPREALMEYVRYINDEIAYKRKEFGLPVIDDK
ncbi:extracellular solute-binding protein [Anaeromicropila populeti]|uniref:ABC-type glycerol-3-phosphate transport system, substrate-binding protein n=1 Tax=Anaeromicropila populeti TaxID=37658 RepID=A0A1I6LKH8_9FIRM|nr:extracellular solute-binding protein [Anaeromicropila populeti]SFS03810.1 ABC-type glycerol-3-phosphate transport system, substrate-binding protein [Anaeromicropila populeti]